MTAGAGISDGERLYALVADEDLRGFLEGMCAVAADVMYRAAGTLIATAVTVDRRKRATLSVGSNANAARLQGIAQFPGQGPGTEAHRTEIPPCITDVIDGSTWPGHQRNRAGGAAGSVLAIPIHAGAEADGVLSFFAPATGVFGNAEVTEAMRFADTASRALRVALRVAAAEELATHRRAALESRTAIDVACGMIMAENRCSKEQAFDILRRASNNRNEKLGVLAQDLIARTAGFTVMTAHFDD